MTDILLSHAPRDGAPAPASRPLADGLALGCAGFAAESRWRSGERLEDLFEARCQELRRSGRADTPAVDGPGGSLSYDELDRRANQLARHLSLRVGIGPGDRVGLLFAKPLDAYVGMLAVLKLHAAYVPLDAAFPAERIAYIVRDAELEAVLTDVATAEIPSRAAVVRLDDERWLAVAGERDDPIAVEPTGPPPVDELCYVIYTSGTTGVPKGVAVRHSSICNFVRVAAETYGVLPQDRMFQGLTIAFDFCVEEIWVAWMAGATLVPRPSSTPLLGAELHAFLTEQRVTALCCVPTLLATLDRDLPDLRFLLVSGETCPPDLVERWYRPGRRFLNVYGPTEVTVSATWSLLDPDRPVTIGVPLPTYSTVVLDPDQDRALPPGEPGELGIAGIGLAQGYLGRPDLDARAFVPDFLGLPANPSGRIYRTGDLVRVTGDGEIEHLGRLDTQVKVRGYRIELAEIEAVMRAAAGIGQAVVAARELQPVVTELVAYYTVRAGGPEPDPGAVRALLRRRLPTYMVPDYLERLDELPIMPSGKLDRRRLPEPTSPRLGVQAATVDESDDPLERTLSDALAETLRAPAVPATSDFFDDLGANSLLMAGFIARLRQAAPELGPVSMREVYLHRSVRSLARALRDPAERAAAPSPPVADEPVLPEPVGTPHHALCGALQLLSVLVYSSVAGLALDAGSRWLLAASGASALYLRAVVFGCALIVGTGLVPVAAKWILIGRFRPMRIRVWSLPYVRFWVVKTLLLANPLPHLLRDTPLLALYLRALGVRVGDRVLVLTRHLPVCADLIAIGSDVVIHQDVYLNGYRARDGMIEIGSVSIAPNGFVGERCVLDIGTRIGNAAELGHASSLQAGQAVPDGACWHGSPARPAPHGHRVRTVAASPSQDARRLRHAQYLAGRLLLLAALLAPIEALLGALLLSHPHYIQRITVPEILAVAGAVLIGLIVLSLILAVAVPRVFGRRLKPGRLYPRYGRHYAMQRLVHRASNNTLLTTMFGDSVMIVGYLRAIGYRLGVVEQTGSNFGLEVRQEVPTLSSIGTGTIVSDGLSILNAEFSSTAFRVMPVKIGERNYLGNHVSFPAGARTGANCLFATKAMVPVGGPVRSDVGLLGSPCFEIPRSVARDRRLNGPASEEERRGRIRAKTRHNLVTLALHLLVEYVLIAGLLLSAALPLGGRGLSDLAGTVAGVLLDGGFALVLFVVAERAVTGFRPLQARACSILEPDFWRHERYWKVAPTGYVHALDGTPFKPVLWRALGVPIGRGVFDDGLNITERTLVTIGEGSTFNMGSHLQSHTLEDGAFKSERIRIGRRCTIGTGALVNYGAVLRDGAYLEPDSFLMKGSRMEPGTRWGGNPATELGTGTPLKPTESRV